MYRELKKGEVIKKGDELKIEEPIGIDDTWKKVSSTLVGKEAEDSLIAIYRRKV